MDKLRVAVYCRLSRDDGLDESQSIVTQKRMLEEYATEKGWLIQGVYTDDGFSGTNFDRPGFNRMLRSIEIGLIDIVLTKDLSRLGRNYIQTGYFIEEYFPSHGVRFIAVNDNFDTVDESRDDFVPFKNIINEWYAKDISKKIRFTLDNMAKNGVPRNTVFPIFGYKYNEKYERIPDEETAPIVKLIFQKYIEYGSSVSVAKFLSEHQYKTPTYYNAVKYNFNKQKVLNYDIKKMFDWKSETIRDIISKKEYLGDYITAKTKSKDFKNKKRFLNNGCYNFSHKYQPLIDESTWEVANKILKRSRSGKVPANENIFKGNVYCADCGSKMRFEKRVDKKNNNKICCRYYCSSSSCKHTNSITKDRLVDIINSEFTELKSKIIENFDNISCFFEKILSKKTNLGYDYDNEIKKINKKNDLIDSYVKTLFEDRCNCNIPQSTYEFMLDRYIKEKEVNLLRLQDLKNMQSSKKNFNIDYNGLKNFELNFLSINKLIKKIFVSSSSINGSCKNFEYEIKIIYPRCENNLLRI